LHHQLIKRFGKDVIENVYFLHSFFIGLVRTCYSQP